MPRNKYARLVSDIFIFSVGTLLTKVVQFLLMPLYTLRLAAQAYGVAELTNNMSDLLFPIATLCIYEAVFRYVVVSKFKKEEIISASFRVVTYSAIAGAALLMLANLFIRYQYGWYLFFILYANSIKTIAAFYVRSKGNAKLFAASGVVNAVLLAVFSYLLLYVFNLGIDGYLLVIALANACTFLFLFLGGKMYRDVRWNATTGEVTKTLLRFSIPLIVYNIGYWLTTISGRYILLWFTDASTVGLYAAVIKIGAVINMLQQAFYAAFQLNTTREYHSADKEAFYSNVFRLYAGGIIMLGSFLLCLSPLLAQFALRNEFYQARVYLPLILFTAIFDCIFCFFKTMYTTFKLTKKAIPSMAVGAAVNIGVGLLTVQKFGIWGICFSSFLCYLAQAVYRVFDVNRFVRLRCNWKTITPLILLVMIQVELLSYDHGGSYTYACLCAAVVFISGILVYRKDFAKIMQPLIRRRAFPKVPAENTTDVKDRP